MSKQKSCRNGSECYIAKQTGTGVPDILYFAESRASGFCEQCRSHGLDGAKSDHTKELVKLDGGAKSDHTKELVKLDGGKAPLDFLPLRWMSPIAWVMRGGAKKYSRNGWSKGEAKDVVRYIAAVYRHCGAVEEGEFLDPESGLPHLAHAACSMVMACGLALKNKVLGFEDGWEQKQKGFWS